MLDFTQEEKDFFMSEALKEAEKSLVKAEIPIGCVIVKDGEDRKSTRLNSSH